MSYQPDPFEQPLVAGDTAVTPVVRPAAVRPVTPLVSSPHLVEQVVYAQPAVVQRRAATSYVRRIAPDSIIVGIIGAALMIIGLIAVTRAGVDGPMSQPVVKVIGFTHTATLGAIEVAIGVLLLICAATSSRGGATFFGVISAWARSSARYRRSRSADRWGCKPDSRGSVWPPPPSWFSSAC